MQASRRSDLSRRHSGDCGLSRLTGQPMADHYSRKLLVLQVYQAELLRDGRPRLEDFLSIPHRATLRIQSAREDKSSRSLPRMDRQQTKSRFHLLLLCVFCAVVQGALNTIPRSNVRRGLFLGCFSVHDMPPFCLVCSTSHSAKMGSGIVDTAPLNPPRTTLAYPQVLQSIPSRHYLGRHSRCGPIGILRLVSHGKPFLNRTWSSSENGGYLRRSLF